MMYDTLMQMGRWFGYRPGYEDLCRVWMPEDGVGWYAHIHEAMDDLQIQLKRMELAKATPEQFGLAVRSHPETLIVTARNKMGTGKEIPMKVSLAEKLVETTRIRNDAVQIAKNGEAGAALVNAMLESGGNVIDRPRGSLIRDVPVELIRDFLLAYRSDTADPLTDPRLINDYIDARSETELAVWDVLVASAQKDDIQPEPLGPIAIKPFERKVGVSDLGNGSLSISGASRRVGSPGDEKEGLTEDQIARATEDFRQRLLASGKRDLPATLPPRIFCEIEGRRPLLVLRYVTPKVDGEPTRTLPKLVLAWGICFPPSDISGGTVDYVVNTIRMKELFGEADEDEEVFGDVE